MFIFEKCPEPITVEQKYKLALIGSFCVNEEVKAAAYGSLRLTRKQNQEGEAVDRKSRTAYSRVKTDDQEMVESEATV